MVLIFALWVCSVRGRLDGSVSQRCAPIRRPRITRERRLDYENHRSDEHEFPYTQGTHDHANEEFPSDRPYAFASKTRRISVGRLPARASKELRDYVQKLIAYETPRGAGAWRQRLVVTTGRANFGALADGAIEAVATEMLDEKISYDFHVRFTLAKFGSPYVGRLDQRHTRWRTDMESGALIAAYAGHGSAYGFDDEHFRDRHHFIGTKNDADLLDIQRGNPDTSPSR